MLWSVLARLDVAGRFMDAIKSLYTHSTYSINIGGRVGQPHASLAGVKQGCPLSPTLFGLFMDGLQRYLEDHCPLTGPSLNNGDHVPALMYADDVVLLADSATDLQALVTATVSFCSAVGLKISTAKSSVLTFFGGSASRPTIAINYKA